MLQWAGILQYSEETTVIQMCSRALGSFVYNDYRPFPQSTFSFFKLHPLSTSRPTEYVPSDGGSSVNDMPSR